MTILKEGELFLYGFVGDSFWGDGFTASEVVDALIEHGRDEDIVVHINSGGGYTDDGIAIYNSLIAHKGNVKVIVDAMAASSASVIAMAGDERVMLAGSLMMIHDPSGLTWGTAGEHEKTAELLDKLANSMAGIYADVSNDNVEDMRADMKETLWLTVDEAVERGFATSADVAASQSVAAFDYRLFANAPDKLCALSKEKSWSLKSAMASKAAASAPAKPGHKGDTILSKKDGVVVETTTTSPDVQTDGNTESVATQIEKAVAADRNRRSDILALDEANGREKLAESLFEAGMTADTAKSVLAVAPTGSKDGLQDAQSYDETRTTGSNLAQPAPKQTGSKAKINRSDIFALRAKQMKGD